jgi:hypothetical protein
LSEIPQILVKDKWETYVKTGDTLEDAALDLLSERVDDGFWYDNWDTSDPTEQYEDRAQQIVESKDGQSSLEVFTRA